MAAAVSDEVHLSAHEEPSNMGGGSSEEGGEFSGGGGCRVYVGNLAWRTKWQDLKDHMRQAGNVRHADILTDASGRSKGCAIVQYDSPDQARNATEILTDSLLDGRKIFVREDREMNGRYGPRSSTSNRGSPPGAAATVQPRGRTNYTARGTLIPPLTEETTGKQVVAFNLPWTVTTEELQNTFAKYGDMVKAEVCVLDDGRSRGSGYVIYRSAEEADRAVVGMNGQEMCERQLLVKIDLGPRSRRDNNSSEEHVNN